MYFNTYLEERNQGWGFFFYLGLDYIRASVYKGDYNDLGTHVFNRPQQPTEGFFAKEPET